MGNDIVDLSAPGAAGKCGDSRFVQRVFTPAEQDFIQGGHNPDQRLWALWACKETAYKIASKIDPRISSAPRRYPVEFYSHNNLQDARALVTTPRGPVTAGVTLAGQDCIHVVGADGTVFPDRLVHGANRIDLSRPWDAGAIVAARSRSARAMATRAIAAHLHTSESRLRIVRHESGRRLGPPKIFQDRIPVPLDISLSHDGRFAGYAFSPFPFAVGK
ncbi:MAG: 4'-phosphopantetheinyl transferase superfamily protein [Thermodesulfobacteriota bacterium]